MFILLLTAVSLSLDFILIFLHIWARCRGHWFLLVPYSCCVEGVECGCFCVLYDNYMDAYRIVVEFSDGISTLVFTFRVLTRISGSTCGVVCGWCYEWFSPGTLMYYSQVQRHVCVWMFHPFIRVHVFRARAAQLCNGYAINARHDFAVSVFSKPSPR